MRYRSTLFAAAMALLCSIGPLRAATLLSVTGVNPPDGQDVRIDGNSLAAVHWTTSTAYTNVSITAQLYCTPCMGKNDVSFADAYLMKQIGPLVTPAQQVAFSRVRVTGARTFVTLFSGLTLPAGEYYLVVYSPFTSQSGPLTPGASSGPAIAWGGTSDANAVVVAAPGVSREPMLIYANNLAAPLINAQFPPSSFFSRSPTTPSYDLNGSYNLQFQVLSTPAVVIPQFAAGAGWKTTLSLVNLDQTLVDYKVLFWDDDGKSLPVTMTPGGTLVAGSLQPGGTFVTESSGTASTLLQGWAEIVATGRVAASAVLRRDGPGGTYRETTIAGMASTSLLVLNFDNTQGFVTTIAMANGNPNTSLTVALIAQLEDGTQKQGTVTLVPHGHSAFALTSILPEVAGARGSLRISAPTPDLSAIGLRFDPNGSFVSSAIFQ